MSGLKPYRLPPPTGMRGFGFSIDFVIKDWFFNSDNVKKHLSKNERMVLSRFGAYVRTSARHSMKHVPFSHQYRPDKTFRSKPGEPPFSHSRGGTTKDGGSRSGGLRYGPFNIIYGYNPETKSVVIGPRKVTSKNDYVPFSLEYGKQDGTVVRNKRRIDRTVGSVGAISYKETTLTRERRTNSSRTIRGVDGKMYEVWFTRLKTSSQVEKSTRIEEKIFGPKMLKFGPLAPRPYMKPAFWKGMAMLPKFWEGARRTYFTGSSL